MSLANLQHTRARRVRVDKFSQKLSRNKSADIPKIVGE